jgi:hypothetical protein
MKNVFNGGQTGRIGRDELDSSSGGILHAPSTDLESEITSLLNLHKASLCEHKMLYYQGRSMRQATQTAHGSLTVKVHYVTASNLLVVNILNAKNLKSYDSNGELESFFNIYFGTPIRICFAWSLLICDLQLFQ